MKFDLPVGSITKYKEYKLVVVSQKFNMPSCEGCVFNKTLCKELGEGYINCSSHNLACTPIFRKDGIHVIFKLTE